ncbi:tetraacyldisaccharide 4'-kinase [Marinomonas sp. THO17]|uniref:tetraacyldisaccharide 4'-kinase n=1 Tax=Marinomonas sp. THO17 TaxID=3149048 RepID=UPI00336BB0FE
MSLEICFTKSWYRRLGWTQVFRPLQPLVRHIVNKKRQDFLAHKNAPYRAPVPVVVVGNISVGGTGKSPMVIALSQWLSAQGYRVGLISRGHGVQLDTPILVTAASLASEVGDEPVMLVQRTGCPMAVFTERKLAIETLLTNHDIDIIISDDGMQHYAMARDIEIAMVDAQRGLGNGQLLPVGPLREPKSRLGTVDFVVSITEHITPALQQLALSIHHFPLTSSTLSSLDGLRSVSCQQAFKETHDWHLMAGIGNPQRFENTLLSLGLPEGYTHHWYSDHHAFSAKDIIRDRAVIMTEKDAVKCRHLEIENQAVWYLPVTLNLSEAFKEAFLAKLNDIKH